MIVRLTLATLVLCAGVIPPLFIPRLPIWARALWRLAVLILLTMLVVRVAGSPLHPVYPAGDVGLRLWQQAIAVAWWVVAARGIAGIARLLFSLRTHPRETRILSDLTGAGIYAATTLAIVDIVFAVPIAGLIATSGVIAVVMGLALNNTLADVFAGIAIDLERPYKAGNLLWVEGGIEGRVQEVNWRSTVIVTGNGDVAIVPNSVMAKVRLINYSLPSRIRRSSVEVALGARVLPEHCGSTLQAAIRACVLLLPTPPPTVNLTHLRGDGAVYEISFSVPSSDDLAAARSELLQRVQRHLAFAGIPLAVGGVAAAPDRRAVNPTDLLALTTPFDRLTDVARTSLAAAMVEKAFAEGAVLFVQGDAIDGLHFVARGVVEILHRRKDGRETKYRASPGSCLGIVGFVAGAPFAATGTALTALTTFKLDKAGLASAIQAQPALRADLETLAHRSQEVVDQDLTAGDDHRNEPADVFHARMLAFMHRLTQD